MVDEATDHFIDQPGVASKSNAAVTNGIQKIIHVTYNGTVIEFKLFTAMQNVVSIPHSLLSSDQLKHD
jgi:hypothetical protein